MAAGLTEPDPYRLVRRYAVTAWAVALTVFILWRGIPLERFIQTLWILIGIFAFNVGRPWRSYGRILLDWLPFVGFLWLYDFTRGFAETLGMPTHVTQPLDLEKWLFHGIVPTQWLQQHLYNPGDVHWYDVIVSLVYFSHFLVVWVYAGVLYVRERARWGKWARRILMLSYAGLVTYILYPAAPPWFAEQFYGLIPGIARISSNGWLYLNLHSAGALIQNAQGGANDVAAMPSLHGAFTAMLTVFVWPRLNNLGRVLMVLYTLSMAFTLVYSAEHYVVDILMGYGYVAAVLLAAWWWERMRDGQRARAAAGAEPSLVASPGTGGTG